MNKAVYVVYDDNKSINPFTTLKKAYEAIENRLGVGEVYASRKSGKSFPISYSKLLYHMRTNEFYTVGEESMEEHFHIRKSNLNPVNLNVKYNFTEETPF